METGLRIGKRGVTEGLMREISSRLETKGLIKLKVLKSRQADLEPILKSVSELANAEVIDRRGFTFVLKKKGLGG